MSKIYLRRGDHLYAFGAEGRGKDLKQFMESYKGTGRYKKVDFGPIIPYVNNSHILGMDIYSPDICKGILGREEDGQTFFSCISFDRAFGLGYTRDVMRVLELVPKTPSARFIGILEKEHKELESLVSIGSLLGQERARSLFVSALKASRDLDRMRMANLNN